jgi:hypothetical protein
MKLHRKNQIEIEVMLLNSFIRRRIAKTQQASEKLTLRDLGIQNAKLKRMLAAKEDPYAGLARSSKKLAKERGRRDRRIDLQHRKVRDVLRRFVESQAPNATRREMKETIKEIEEMIAESVEFILKQV